MRISLASQGEGGERGCRKGRGSRQKKPGSNGTLERISWVAWQRLPKELLGASRSHSLCESKEGPGLPHSCWFSLGLYSCMPYHHDYNLL